VQVTADDALVVCHDTATVAGAVADLTLGELRRVLPEAPVLGDCLAVLADRLVNVEVKHEPAEFLGPGDDAARGSSGCSPRCSRSAGPRAPGSWWCRRSISGS
jgi:hypothetical protein